MDAGEYPSLDAAAKDFYLMFNNAKTYNIEGSEIYEDAVALEKVCRETVKRIKGKRAADSAAPAAKHSPLPLEIPSFIRPPEEQYSATGQSPTSPSQPPSPRAIFLQKLSETLCTNGSHPLSKS